MLVLVPVVDDLSDGSGVGGGVGVVGGAVAFNRVLGLKKRSLRSSAADLPSTLS